MIFRGELDPCGTLGGVKISESEASIERRVGLACAVAKWKRGTRKKR